MSLLTKAWDFLTFKDLPANQPVQLRAAPPRSLSAAVPGWHNGKPTWPADNVMVLTRDGYRKCVTAFACINVIADAVAEATLRIWEDQGAGKRDELPDHPLRALLQHPNPRYSEAEFLALTVRIAAIAGYCVIEKVRARAGNVVQLGHIRPDYLKPILRDQLLPDWEVTIPGHKPERLSADDAIVFTYMDSPFLDVTGDTPLRAVLREAGILAELTDFVKLLLERGGMPQIVLVVDSAKEGDVPLQLTDDEREAMRQQFIAKYGGARNWAGPAILEGMKVETVSFDLNQMAFKDLRDGLDLKVCQAFRVPAPVVQIQAGLTTSYGKLLEESMTLLQLYTANPIRNRLDGALTRQLLPEFDTRPSIDLGFDTSTVKALQEDEDAVHTRTRENLKAGLLTLDEARQRIGEVALENDLGKSLYLPFSVILTPADGEIEAKPQPTPTTETPPAEEDDAGEREFVLTPVALSAEQEAAYRRMYEPHVVTRDGRRYVNVRALTPAQRAVQAKVAGHHRKQIVRLANLVQPKVKRYFEEQRDRIVAALVGERSVVLLAYWRSRDASLTPDDVRQAAEDITHRAAETFDWLFEQEELRKIFEQWWATVSEAAFADASEELAQELIWNVANPQLQELFDALGYRITDIVETTRQAVETVIRESLIEGTSIDELAQNLRDVFDETYKNRHVTVARTESQVAYNLSSQRAYAEAGGISYVQLHDNPQHDTDPGPDGLTCAQRNNLIVRLAEMTRHVEAEHPNGTLGVSPILDSSLGEE